MNALKTLVMMQLKDKLDLSFVKSPRKTLFKVAGILAQVLLSGGAFFLFFYLASAFKLFSFTGRVPDTLLTAMFTLIIALSVISCTVGLTKALYLAEDNRVLLTLPVSSDLVFLSKFVLYYIFELKRNLFLLAPMYVAYGIVCKAVWHYYPWAIVCCVLISLMTVAVGAVLSIPSLFISNVVRRYKWLQLTLLVAAVGLVCWVIFLLIGLLPENINIAGRWGTISVKIQETLSLFARKSGPLNIINLMVVGGDAVIMTKLFTLNALWGMLIVVGSIAVCVGIAALAARPLFFKMASSQFEYEKNASAAKKNVARKAKLSPFVYVIKRNFRSTRYVVQTLLNVMLLPIAVYFLNKTYAAMNTKLMGQYMTVAFSMLVCLLIVTGDNIIYSSVYSVDGAARPIAKTQPVSPEITMFAKILPRVVTTAVSVIIAASLWRNVSKLSAYDAAMLGLSVIFVGLAHLFWSAELDVMNPQHDQFATVGMNFNNPNELKSTVAAFLLSALFAVVLFFLLSEGQSKAVTKVMLVSAAFLAVRAALYFVRIKLYYTEK